MTAVDPADAPRTSTMTQWGLRTASGAVILWPSEHAAREHQARVEGDKPVLVRRTLITIAHPWADASPG